VAHDPQGRPPAQAAGLTAPRTHARVVSLFLRSLGAIHVIAFLSLGVQIEGLIGSRGILPATELLGFVAARTDATRYWLLPTVFWLDASDAALRGACWAGAAAGALLALGFAPLPNLLASWVLYLSLTTVGQVFLGYQWDGLLLETTLLAVFLAPRGLWLRPREPAAPALWLLRSSRSAMPPGDRSRRSPSTTRPSRSPPRSPGTRTSSRSGCTSSRVR